MRNALCFGRGRHPVRTYPEEDVSAKYRANELIIISRAAYDGSCHQFLVDDIRRYTMSWSNDEK